MVDLGHRLIQKKNSIGNTYMKGETNHDERKRRSCNGAGRNRRLLILLKHTSEMPE